MRTSLLCVVCVLFTVSLPWPPLNPRGGIPTRCVYCDAELLNPHQLDGICQECKLILRNERPWLSILTERTSSDD